METYCTSKATKLWPRDRRYTLLCHQVTYGSGPKETIKRIRGVFRSKGFHEGKNTRCLWPRMASYIGRQCPRLHTHHIIWYTRIYQGRIPQAHQYRKDGTTKGNRNSLEPRRISFNLLYQNIQRARSPEETKMSGTTWKITQAVDEMYNSGLLNMDDMFYW